MKKYIDNIFGQKGSMMVEALAMLGLITMVTPILYKKAAERTSELQDINTAAHMRTIAKAMDDYIKEDYTALAAGPDKASVALNKLDPYLPHGFNINSSRLLGDYEVAIRLDTMGSRTGVTGLVIAKPQTNLPKLRTSKIASMIGANGGIVEGADITGVGGNWTTTDSNFGLSTGAVKGGIAVSSSRAILAEGGGSGSGGVSNEDVLYRKLIDSDPLYNTMETDLFMNGGGKQNNIEGVGHLITQTELIEGATRPDGSAYPADHDETVFQVENGKTVLSHLSAGGVLDVIKDTSATFNKNLITAAGVATELGGTLTVAANQATLLGGTLTVAEDQATTLGGTLTVATGKTTSLGGDLNVRDIFKAVEKNSAGPEYEVIIDKPATGSNKFVSNVASEFNDHVTITPLASATEGLLVKGDATVEGTLDVGTLKANTVEADVTLSGGLDGSDYNFVARQDSVAIKNPAFAVAANRLLIDSNDSYIQSAGSDPTKLSLTDTKALLGYTDDNGITVSSSEIAAKSGNINLNDTLNVSSDTIIGDAETTTLTNTASFSATGGTTAPGYVALNEESAAIGVQNGSGATFDSGAKIYTGTGHMLDVPSDGVITAKGEVFKFNSGDTNILYVDDGKMILAENAANLKDNAAGTTPANGIIFRRNGAIELPRAQTDKDIGYIKADRFIANQGFQDPRGSGILSDEPTATAEHYDSYQLNPAYTSVMHDIKLTTRGGARLSDILPDFINRGIYVLDNDRKEDKLDWSTFSITLGSPPTVSPAGSTCSSADCITSPWLGFIPLAQCPPGYDKVVTLNPIRWKMSEAYYITGASMDGVTDASQNFRNYFVPPTNPANAKFTLSEEEGNGVHTHHLAEGGALTFQTNTWLNTTVSKATGDGGNVVGWHAIMGFLYYGSWYKDYLEGLKDKITDYDSKDYDNSVVWNLFPVYYQEMSAIGNVYCYFGRDGSRISRWNNTADNTLIYQYDQLTNYRADYNKDSDYVKRLNDPALGYKEVW